MHKINKLILKMVYTALFSSLTFAGTYINIRLAVGGMIHLGNFVAIFASLLFGGVVGGISGSLGMGLFDLINGFEPSTVIRTFIVKFIVCFFIGIISKKLFNRKKENKILLLITIIIFMVSGLMFLGYYIFDKESLSSPTLILVLSIMMIIFALGVLVLFILYKRTGKLLNSVLVATSFGILLNVLSEFVLRTVLLTLFGQTFNSSLNISLVKIPSALINGIITIVLISLFFLPIYFATKNINKLDNFKNTNKAESD